jgi:hypothetical protein
MLFYIITQLKNNIIDLFKKTFTGNKDYCLKNNNIPKERNPEASIIKYS